jgi:hypothetical protein
MSLLKTVPPDQAEGDVEAAYSFFVKRQSHAAVRTKGT